MKGGSVARVCLLAALIVAGTTAHVAADEPLDRVAARALMADALYLESGMGDHRGAARIYAEIVDRGDEVPIDLAAEACLRMGLAEEALGQAEQAEEAYRKLLARYPSTSWGADARGRLQSLEEDRKVVRSLPVEFRFGSDVGGLFHARSRSNKGRITPEQVEKDGTPDGVAAWRTYVIGGEDDIVVLGFDPQLELQGTVELAVRAANFPAHLSFFLVHQDGTRYGSHSWVVRPEEGWQQLALEAADFQDRAGGSAGGLYRPGTGIRFLMIQDVTGHSSTDRGENLILIDDLTVR